MPDFNADRRHRVLASLISLFSQGQYLGTAITLLLEKFKTKGLLVIVLITKAEKEYLVSKGVPFGYTGISHTVGKHRTFYLCENARNMGLLKKFREKMIAE